MLPLRPYLPDTVELIPTRGALFPRGGPVQDPVLTVTQSQFRLPVFEFCYRVAWLGWGLDLIFKAVPLREPNFPGEMFELFSNQKCACSHIRGQATLVSFFVEIPLR